jgi:RNA polymerase sigma-70 factor (ECF subfamily)
MDYDEQPLVDLARAGDRNAFRQLVERHSHSVFRVAWRITGDEALAEDAVQEAFVNAWRRLDRFRGDARFGTWMHRITVNAALGLVRKRTRRREENLEDSEMDAVMNRQSAQSSQEAQPDQVMHQHDLGEATRVAMAGLSDMERGTFVLRHFEEMSIREIGQAMDMNEGAVKQALFRAVRKMRVTLETQVRQQA